MSAARLFAIVDVSNAVHELATRRVISWEWFAIARAWRPEASPN